MNFSLHRTAGLRRALAIGIVSAALAATAGCGGDTPPAEQPVEQPNAHPDEFVFGGDPPAPQDRPSGDDPTPGDSPDEPAQGDDPPGGGQVDAPGGDPPDGGPEPIDDSAPFLVHARTGFATAREARSWCDIGKIPIQCKFIFTRFSEPGVVQHDYFIDPSFYRFHDEYYWFRMLNGVGFDDWVQEPVTGLQFDTVADVYDTFGDADDLPLELTFTGFDRRILSETFYAAAEEWDERYFGIGSLLYFPPDEERARPEELWLFELEFTDNNVDAAIMATFFERLSATLPPDVVDKLAWLPRSLEHEALASELEVADHPLRGRIVRHRDLVVAGRVEGYNLGITAGILERVGSANFGSASLQPFAIPILETIPADLPPVSGVISAVPQTPLSHINLLAKSRGTPNVYMADALVDSRLREWEVWRAPVVMRVRTDALDIQAIDNADFWTWWALQGQTAIELVPVPLDGLPRVVDLRAHGLEDMPHLIPRVGGKAAGMAAFAAVPAMILPDAPMAITVRAYEEHIDPLRGILSDLLADPIFHAVSTARFALLEGVDTFLAAHADSPFGLDEWVAGFQEDFPPGTLFGDILAAGGVKRMIRDQPLDTAFAAELAAEIARQYAHLDPAQGLRFRSSSTAEDAEGFTGAGLYDSNTGFRDPSGRADPKERQRTLEWALKKTWASFWNFGAFEERRLAGIEHMDARMAVLVHPRFDDPAELANGVINVHYARKVAGDEAQVVVNVQAGSLSVTNPDLERPGTPEIDEIVLTVGGRATVRRVQGSSEVGVDETVLSDEELRTLAGEVAQLADAWLTQVNAPLPIAHRRTTVILDLEFKKMAAGWPARSVGPPRTAGIVYKQVRPLDAPSLATPEVAAMPIPRDILSRLARVDRRTCTAGLVELETVDVYTDPSRTWGGEYATRPFNGEVTIRILSDLPALGLLAGDELTFDHSQTSFLGHPFMDQAEWDLYAVPTVPLVRDVTLDAISFRFPGAWSLRRGGATAEGTLLDCTTETVLEGPTAFLESLLDP